MRGRGVTPGLSDQTRASRFGAGPWTKIWPSCRLARPRSEPALTIPNDILTHTPLLQFEAAEAVIQTGDILLGAGTHAMSRLIRLATHSDWSHVAFAVRVDSIDRVLVCESVEKIGVRALPLHTFLYGVQGKKPFPGPVLLARNENLTAASPDSIRAMTDFALDQLGDPFATWEILKIATRILVGAAERPMPQALAARRDFICSEYAALCFQKAGVTIPWDGRGFIAPCDFALDPAASAIGRIDTSPPRA